MTYTSEKLMAALGGDAGAAAAVALGLLLACDYPEWARTIVQGLKSEDDPDQKEAMAGYPAMARVILARLPVEAHDD